MIYSYYLTGPYPSVAWSNIMGVPDPISGHRSVRLCHYIIFINTRGLFLTHLWIICPPPLIPELYTLLLPPDHDHQGSWPPLLRHRNVNIWPHSNVLVHTVLEGGDVITNCPRPCVHQLLTNWKGLQLSILELRHPSRYPLRYPIMPCIQQPHNAGCHDPRLLSRNQYRLDHCHIEPPRGPGFTPLPYQ